MTNTEFIELKNDVKDIKSALLGEGTHKDNGIIDRVCKAEKTIQAHNKVLWAVSGAVSFVAGFGVLLFNIIKSMSE